MAEREANKLQKEVDKLEVSQITKSIFFNFFNISGSSTDREN